jgi:hypothetical protein
VTNSLRVLYGRLPDTAHSGSRIGSDGRPGGLGAEELDAGSSCGKRNAGDRDAVVGLSAAAAETVIVAEDVLRDECFLGED